MSTEVITVPDLGGAEEVEVIEISVAVGDRVEADQTLLVLESDKAMMEIPAPRAGKIIKFFVGEEDKIEKEGDPLVEIETAEGEEHGGEVATETVSEEATGETEAGSTSEAPKEVKEQEPAEEKSTPTRTPNEVPEVPDTPVEDSTADQGDKVGDEVYAGPAVRQLARELGVSLTGIAGSGPRGRVLKEDVQAHVKHALQNRSADVAGVSMGAGIPP
ncbi:MAG TPA: dihydrolipoamide acetyltransferase, partial [Porticoccaceae bacterium]|nr:dihydrolipoamide acetyltransferase [Porticoccaceae bacterium]